MTLIIAEAGVNHNGDAHIAHQLIDAAVAAGADIIKFQTFKTDRLVTAKADKAAYQKKTTSVSESQYAMLERLELTEELHVELSNHCRERGIEFLSSGFDITSVDLLAKLGVKRFKIPSGEITNLPYLRHVAHFRKPVILSTGMATLGEIDVAMETLIKEGTPRSLITVLHCNSEYPTPMNDVNLRAMLAIRDAFQVQVGYSDHTTGIEVPIAAVALGACVIEKHFTLDGNLAGPDHKASLEPTAFTAMVAAIRNIEQALGDGIKRPSPSEIQNRSIVRKSLVATQVIRTGDLFTESNLTVKRPGTGLSPLLWDVILGRTATRDYAPDELIEL